MTESPLHDRVAALAGVARAAVLVDEIANGRSAPPAAYAAAVGSLFALDAPTVDAALGGNAAALVPGRDFLRKVLRRETGEESSNRISYMMAMLHLNAVLRGDPDMQRIINTRLAQIAEGARSDDERTRDDVIAKLAALYVDTFGALRFRVQVKGDPRHLQSAETAARIRVALFAGIRAAHLWHHLGGRRWQLLFGMRRMLDALGD